MTGPRVLRWWRTCTTRSNELPTAGGRFVGSVPLPRPRSNLPPSQPPPTALIAVLQGPPPSSLEVADARRAILCRSDDDHAARVLFLAYGRLLVLLAKRWAPRLELEESHALVMAAALEVFTDPAVPSNDRDVFVRHLMRRVTHALRTEHRREMTPLSLVGRAVAAVRRAAHQAEERPDGLTAHEATIAALPKIGSGQVEALRQAIAMPLSLDDLGNVARFEDPDDCHPRTPAEELMEQALETLEPHEQRLLVAFYGLRGHPQLSSAELAMQDGLPLATMQKRLTRCRDHLKSALALAREAQQELLLHGVCRLGAPTNAASVYRAEKNRRFPRAVQQLAAAVITMAQARHWALEDALSAVERIVVHRQRMPDATFILEVQDRLRQALGSVPAPVRSTAPAVYGEQLAMFASSVAPVPALVEAFAPVEDVCPL